MDTQVRTPQLVFMQPQRLIVPLFQRPYVWNQENQWEPLWKDVVRVDGASPRRPRRQAPAALPRRGRAAAGAEPDRARCRQRTIIDGQQRLTTLQLLLDALHAELLAVGATQPAMRLEALVQNPAAFCVAARGPVQGVADEPGPPGVQRRDVRPAAGRPRRPRTPRCPPGRGAPLLHRAGARVAHPQRSRGRWRREPRRSSTPCVSCSRSW